MDEPFHLDKDIEVIVDAVMEMGRYATREDVLREGVKLVQEREQRRAELFAAIDEGIADAEAGRFEDIEVVAARLKAKYSDMARRAG